MFKHRNLLSAKAGDIMEVEVIHKEDRGKSRYLIVESRNDQQAVLIVSELAGKDRSDREARFSELRARVGEEPGSKLEVLVVHADSGVNGWTFEISERRLAIGSDDHDGDLPATNVVSPEALAKARLALGKKLTGRIVGNAADGGLVIDLREFKGVLPSSNLGRVKSASLRRGENTRVIVKSVSETGIILTKENVA